MAFIKAILNHFIFPGVLSIIVIALYCFFSSALENRKYRMLYDHITWLREGNLIYNTILNKVYVFKENYADFPEHNAVSKEDTKALNEILNSFQNYEREAFFADPAIKRQRIKFSHEDFFFVELHDFLQSNNGTSDFQGKLYTLKNRTDYETYSKTEYSLTDFGVVYYKLLFIAQFYCESCGEISKKLRCLDGGSKLTAEILDLGYITHLTSYHLFS